MEIAGKRLTSRPGQRVLGAILLGADTKQLIQAATHLSGVPMNAREVKDALERLAHRGFIEWDGRAWRVRQ